jgi:hypothetical protein
MIRSLPSLGNRDPKVDIHHRPSLTSTLVSGTHGERMLKELPLEAERAEFDRWLKSTAEAKPRDEERLRAERELTEAWDLVISGVKHSDTRRIVHLADQLRTWRAKLSVGEEARKFQENLEARELESRVRARQEFWGGVPPRVNLFGEALSGEALAVVCLAIYHEALRPDAERGVRVLETTHDAEDERHRNDREAKAYAQQLVKPKWQAQPDTPIPEMMDTICEIFKQEGILNLKGKPYVARTIRDWIANLAPPTVRKPGRRKSNQT